MILPMPTVIRRATNTTTRLRPFRLTAKEGSYCKLVKSLTPASRYQPGRRVRFCIGRLKNLRLCDSGPRQEERARLRALP